MATMKNRRRRNPLEPPEGKLEAYTIYVASILAPKTKIPVSVYIGESSGRFYVFTPDRKFAVGAGYYGDVGHDNCVRQHMLPGLLDEKDQGTGLGTTLYIAGNAVVAASKEDNSGAFPWRLRSGNCTFSVEGDRYKSADRAWDNMLKHGLTEREEGEGEEEEEEDFEERYDADDFIDRDSVEQRVEDQFGDEGSVSVGSIDTGYVKVSGTVTKLTSGRDVTIDYMRWPTIEQSGLILHMSDLFEDPEDRAIVPPGVFASSDWSHTSDEDLSEFARQNAVAAAVGGEHDEEEWIRETACYFGHGTKRASLMIDLLRGEDGEPAENPRRRNPRSCSIAFAKDDRKWESMWGDSYREPEEREKNPARRLARMRNPW